MEDNTLRLLGEGLADLVKLKKRVPGQTPRPVTGNLEVEPMETKIFSGAELEDFRIFLLSTTSVSNLLSSRPETQR